MLPKTWYKGGGERGGQLEVLVSKQQRSDSSIHTRQDAHKKMQNMMNNGENHLCACYVFTEIKRKYTELNMNWKSNILAAFIKFFMEIAK